MKNTLSVTLSALFLVSCGGSGGSLEPRYVTVHNTMAAMGYAQTAAISEGSLGEGDEVRFDVELRGGTCTTFVALASGGMRDVELRIVDAQENEIGRDVTHDRQAAAQACAPRAGTYTVVLRAAEGSGGYVVSGWSGGQSGGAGVAQTGVAAGPGACDQPIPLALGETVTGTTEGAGNFTAAPCAGGGDAPERVYSIEVSERSMFTATLTSSFDGTLYLLRACGEVDSMVACNDDAPDTSRSRIDATVDPGVYYLVVDGYENAAGNYTLQATAQALQPLSAVCGGATPLPVGQPTAGDTSQQIDYFQATCANGARGPDQVYALDVDQPARLRVRQRSDHDGVLYVRRSCEDPTTEIACNDDFGDQNRSLVTALVQPGRYAVISDGFAANASGSYTVTAELGDLNGGSASADSCAAPGSLTPGQAVGIDTFTASDDLGGSCGGAGSPDVVYALRARTRSRVQVFLDSAEMETAVYVQRRCGDADTEVACARAPARGARSGNGNPNAPAALDTVVEPGSYSVVIDGQRADAFGAADVRVEMTDLAALARTCNRAPLLRAGRTVNGATRNERDDFQSSAQCAGGSRSPDQLYRLRVTRRSRVVVEMSSDYDGSLHLRSDCVDPSTELACNDDHGDNRHARIEEVLERGTYFLVVDGFNAGNAGTYSIEVDVTAAP